MLLNPEGTMCLTGSSDQTMRLWDLGQQRCVQTFAVHTDSVWVLHASPDFTTVYSGGRDCCVYRCFRSPFLSLTPACLCLRRVPPSPLIPPHTLAEEERAESCFGMFGRT